MKSLRVKTIVTWLAIAFSAVTKAELSALASLDQTDETAGGSAVAKFRQLGRYRGQYSYYGEYYDGKGGKKGSGKKGKGGKKGKKGKGGKGGKGGKKGKHSPPYIKDPGFDCRRFDYLDKYQPAYGYGYGHGKGKGKGGVWNGIYNRNRQLQSTEVDGRKLQLHEQNRQLQSTEQEGRELQFQGQDCSPNTLDVAAKNPDLSIFVSLMEAAGLSGLFSCPGPFTVNAPSNDAFNQNPDLLDYFYDPKNVDDLEETLLYHVIPGFYLSMDFEDGDYKTLQGGTVHVTTRPFKFNQAFVEKGDILACNGALNIIDDVLIPPGTYTFVMSVEQHLFVRIS